MRTPLFRAGIGGNRGESLSRSSGGSIIGCMWARVQASAGPDPVSERRRHGRVRCEAVESSIGPVIEASAGGLRLRTRSLRGLTQGEPVGLVVRAFGDPFSIPVRVVWSRRRGLLTHEVGVEFVEVTAPLRRALSQIALGSSGNTVLETSLSNRHRI